MNTRSAALGLAFATLLSSEAGAQFSGQIPNNTVLGNTSGVTAPARPVAMGSLTTLCGTGTTNRVIKFNASDVCVDSNISDDGSGTAITLASGGALFTTVTQAAGGGNFNATLGSGSGAASNGGSFNLLTGNAGTSGDGGSFTLTTGGTVNGDSGSFALTTGDSTSGDTGGFTFTGGTATSGNGGGFAINLGLGGGGGTDGRFKLVGVPTADPSVTNAIWADSGVLVFSGSTAADPAITQLTGDVTAGPGSGSQAATLANTAVTPASYTLTSLTVDAKGRITAASNGVAKQRVAIGWPAGIDPTGNIIATIDEASTVTSIVGTVTTPLGADGTVLVYKAPSGTACASGTLLHTGSFNANGTANTNQTLTLAGAGAPSLSAGDRICLDVTDDANWATGAAIGGVTVRMTTP